MVITIEINYLSRTIYIVIKYVSYLNATLMVITIKMNYLSRIIYIMIKYFQSTT